MGARESKRRAQRSVERGVHVVMWRKLCGRRRAAWCAVTARERQSRAIGTAINSVRFPRHAQDQWPFDESKIARQARTHQL